jgi:hypothetical protein
MEGWWRPIPRAEPNDSPLHERDAGPAPNPSPMVSGRPSTERPSLSIRDLINRRLHPQQPPHIPSHVLNTRRSSEINQSVQAPEVGSIMAVDADAFRPDVSEVPFSSHAAALFASRANPSTLEPTSQRRLDTTGLDSISEPSYYPWVSRFEENFALSASRRGTNVGERHRIPPESERSSIIQRRAVADLPTPAASAPRPLDVEEFQPGPFRATLERLERQGRQDQQMMMERQAEIDRLRSRLDALQERSVSSSRAPTLPSLRFDPEVLISEAPLRMASPPPRAAMETQSVRSCHIILRLY